MSRMISTSEGNPERAVLVQAVLGRRRRRDAEGSLAELGRLADTAGALVVGSITQRIVRPTAKFYVGQGKLDEIRLACEHTEADLVIFDNDLSPGQVNNLDLQLEIKVIDRTELILQIFARRARSAESQLQVELAQLQYLVTRVPVSRKQHRFTGGIGMRGPGESPFQLRNEPMRKRITAVKRKLDAIGRRRQRTRSHRALPLVALVGYTNAGKSTLLNALSSAHKTHVDDRLFATLDTKTSLVHLPDGRDVLVTDTVGFIRDLPHGLVASFRSTLDEAADADLLLVVADLSHPSVNDHLRVVESTLTDVGADQVPRLLVANKIDSPAAAELEVLESSAFTGVVPVSARKRTGLRALKQTIAESIPQPVAPPPSRGWRDW